MPPLFPTNKDLFILNRPNWAIPEKNKLGGWGPSGNSKQNKASPLETSQNLLYTPFDKKDNKL